MRKKNPKFDRNNESDNDKSFSPKRENKRFNKDSNHKSDKKPFSKEGKERRSTGFKNSFDRKPRETETEQDKNKSFSQKKPWEKREKRDDNRKERGNNSFQPKDDKKPFGRKERDFKKYKSKRKSNEIKPDDGLIRLNKYVANAGICSRRQADEYIKTGLVEVNGTTITEMGYKVKPEDDVRFDGERISPEKKTYVLLNKPKGFITTTKDERDRKTVMDLVVNASSTRLFPVGRLDRQTTGVLLFTNDGHLAKKLTHPSHNVRKIYHVLLDKNLHGDDMDKIRKGIHMQEGVAKVDKISFIDNKPHNEIGIEIHIGWNRVVRRIFEKLGYKVESLDRVEFAGLTKKALKRGDWRILTEKEVGFLKMM